MVRTSLNTCLNKRMLKRPKGLQGGPMVRTSLNTCLRKRKSKKPRVSEKEDRLSDLPDHLLCRILSELSTEDSVRTSVLSKRWTDLYLQVPVFDLDFHDFGRDQSDCLTFLDRFVQSNQELNIERFKFVYDANDYFDGDFMWRISHVIKRRVRHLTVEVDVKEDLVQMPLSLYSCSTLVSLTLYCVVMVDPMNVLRHDPEAKLVSLPCLKTIYLEGVFFDGISVLNTLISRCFVLEDLTVITHLRDYLEEVNVRSQSLKRCKIQFFHVDQNEYEAEFEDEDPDVEINDPNNLYYTPDVVINAPTLEYMSISGCRPKSFEILSHGPFAKLNMDVWFNLKRDDRKINDFLIGISTVRGMIISARSLKFIHKYYKKKPMEPLPQLENLSSLDASLVESSWKYLPTFLGCCLNLRSLSVELDRLPEIEEIELSPVPLCVLSSLEFLKIKTATIAETPRKKELVRCFLMKNCAVLKKLIISEP